MPALPRVVVVGPGGVGAFFGGMLARAGAPLTLLGRSGPPGEHLRAIAADGLRMHTLTFDERVEAGTSNDPSCVRAADLVLFCVKSPDTEAATRAIAPHLADSAIVVGMQNGVDNAEKMRALGVDPIPAVVYVAAAIEAPGTVRHRGRGDLVLGHPDRADDVSRVVGWFAAAGVPCKVSPRVEAELWLKLTINSMANATSALTDKSYEALAEFGPTRDVAVAVAREAAAVARADGFEMDAEAVVEQGLAVARSVGAATSSTQQDIARGRLTEIDALNGYIVKRAELAGIDVPVNRTLWALVKLRERR